MDVYELDHVRTPNASAYCHTIEAPDLYVRNDGKKVEERKDGLLTSKHAPWMER